ncbi:MAG TPA: hypothetical protein VMA35_09975 [Candidatus Sulfopaludibacter sp.]|nr:hypothetical protein [Candidatus Sulfopaludibacter sp.]
MKLRTRTKRLFWLVNGNFELLRKAILLGLLLWSRRSPAQQVLSSAPSTTETPPALQAFETTEMDVFSPAGAAPGPQPAQPFRYQFLTLRPHPDYSLLYADGILSAPGQPENTLIQKISPGFRLDIGDHWILDYTPTWMLYSNNHFQNTFDQAVQLTGGTVYNNWVLELSQSYTKSALPQVETATQTHEEVYATAVDGTYTINSKLSLDLAAGQTVFSADQFQSYREWSTLEWLNYHFWTRFSAAVGIGIGYDDVDQGPNMLFEQYEGRIQWRATDKVSFQVHGGLEDRQFLGGNSGDLLNPVFGGGIQYQPFAQTKISLDAERVVAASVLQNQVTESLNFDTDLNQRLLGRLYLDLTGGYQHVKYINASGTPGPTRKDDFYYFNTRLSTSFLKRGTIAVFYQFNEDASSSAGFGFTSHQVGFEIGFAY